MLEQRLINLMLKQNEERFFLTDDKDSEYIIIRNIIDLIMLGAVPSDYNLYGRVLRTIQERQYSKSIYYGAESEFLDYLNSVLDGDSPYIRANKYSHLKEKIKTSLLSN